MLLLSFFGFFSPPSSPTLQCMCSGCAKVLRFQTNRCPICRQPVDRLLEIKVNNGPDEWLNGCCCHLYVDSSLLVLFSFQIPCFCNNQTGKYASGKVKILALCQICKPSPSASICKSLVAISLNYEELRIWNIEYVLFLNTTGFGMSSWFSTFERGKKKKKKMIVDGGRAWWFSQMVSTKWVAEMSSLWSSDDGV